MTHENVLTKTFMSARRAGLLSSVAGQTFILTRRPVALRRQTNVHVGLPAHRPVILHRQKNVHVGSSASRPSPPDQRLCWLAGLSSFAANRTFMLARRPPHPQIYRIITPVFASDENSGVKTLQIHRIDMIYIKFFCRKHPKFRVVCLIYFWC